MTNRTVKDPGQSVSATPSFRGIPVVLPSTADPRLRVSAIIVSLQVLGQFVLHFKVSIAQILVTIGACALIEMAILYRQRRAWVWPASAILTGNGVAFILRASGTKHGDWWTLNGIQYFLAAGLLGLLSKHFLKVNGRHFFNPSNFGLVLVLLVVGSPSVYPQYLFWGRLSPPVITAVGVILAGVVWLLRPLGMLPMACSFMGVFVLGIYGLAEQRGHCMVAIWHPGQLCGADFWQNICLSPELLVFVFYMMSDPKTAPRGRRARLLYGVTTAVVAVGLISGQTTEYGIKVALLAALTIVCCVVPVLDQLATGRTLTLPSRRSRPVVAAVLTIAMALPLGMHQLARNDDLLDLERGISRTGAPVSQ